MSLNHTIVRIASATVVASSLALASTALAEGCVHPLFPVYPTWPAGDRPDSLAIADFNGDGDVDVAVGNHLHDTVSILFNQGDGTFGAAVNYPVGDFPNSVVAGDLDGDGDVDGAISVRCSAPGAAAARRQTSTATAW